MKNPEINIVRKISPEQKKLLFYAPIGIIILVVCGYILFSGNKVPQKTTKNGGAKSQWELPNDSQKELSGSTLEMEDELNRYNNKKAKNSNDAFFNELSNIDNTSNSKETKELNNKDSMYLKIREQLKGLEETKRREKVNVQPYPVSTSKVKKENITKTTPPKKELTYAEKLKIARAERLGNEDTSSKKTNNKVQTRLAIFRDQFRAPGELVELVLTQSFSYNDKTFPKGTPVYAYININKSRVLFDITNIAHEPLNIEVRDIRDGRLGMYSTRAGELWKSYETQAINNSTESVAEEITNNRFLSNSINAVSSFFQKKRLHNDEKILLLNDQELILNIIDK